MFPTQATVRLDVTVEIQTKEEQSLRCSKSHFKAPIELWDSGNKEKRER